MGSVHISLVIDGVLKNDLYLKQTSTIYWVVFALVVCPHRFSVLYEYLTNTTGALINYFL